MEKKGTLTINVNHDSESSRLILSVEDTGKGIEPRDLANVFDPYFTTRQSGTGLGLAIVHRVIESHNGEIRIESEPGKGTIVTICLPI
jgi:two-component system sensor histidine kinase HydH